jgi:hypothetical protein
VTYDNSRHYSGIVIDSSSSDWTAATVKIVGGGLSGPQFREGYLDADESTFGFQVNDSGTADRRSVAAGLDIRDYTIVTSEPDIGGGYAIASPNGQSLANVLIGGFGIGVYDPFNTIADWLAVTHVGLGGGSHGNAIAAWGGNANGKYATPVKGRLWAGWSRFSRNYYSAPGPSSPRYANDETTALVSFQQSGSAAVGVTDMTWTDTLFDGGTFAISFYPAAAASDAPVRRITFRNPTFTRAAEYGPLLFSRSQGGNDAAEILFIEPRWIDSGEKVVLYGFFYEGIPDGTPLEGVWDFTGGTPVRSPLPAADYDGNPIEPRAANGIPPMPVQRVR